MANTDSIVTARVPKEIREQGDSALKRIGSTVTELVNSAFEYVIRTGELPTSQEPFNPDEKIVRRFSSMAEKEQFILGLRTTTLPVSAEYVSMTAKEIRAQRLTERYEAQV